MAITILAVGALVFFGHFLAGFFERTKVPDVLILMLAGIVLGPVFGVVERGDFGKVGDVFATLALIIILFEGGIHLNVKRLASAAGNTLTISLATLTLTILVLSLLADLLLPVDFRTAVLIGTVLGGTSSAVVVPLIRVLRLDTMPSTVLFLESSITDVLVIVLTLGLVKAMSADPGGAAEAVNGVTLVLDVLRSFLMAGLIGAGGAFLWSALLDKVREFPNTVFTTVAYVFILFGVSEWLGYSGAIAALAFGVAVANFPNIPERFLGRIFSFRLAHFADHERAFFAEAVFLVKTFFFVFLGVSITFSDVRAVLVGIGLAVTAILARALIVRLLMAPATSRRDAALMTALVPKGLAAAVLASIPAQAGLQGAAVVEATVYAVVFFSIVLCAVLIFSVERGSLDRVLAAAYAKFQTQHAPSEPSTPVQIIQESMVLTGPASYEEPNPVTLSDGDEAGAPPAS